MKEKRCPALACQIEVTLYYFCFFCTAKEQVGPSEPLTYKVLLTANVHAGIYPYLTASAPTQIMAPSFLPHSFFLQLSCGQG